MKKHSPHQPQVDVEDLGPVAPKPLQIGKHILFSYIAENLHCWCLQHIAILLCKKQVWNCRVHHYSFLLHELISPNERNVCRKWTILPRAFTTSNIRVVTCELGLCCPVGCQKKLAWPLAEVPEFTQVTQTVLHKSSKWVTSRSSKSSQCHL